MSFKPLNAIESLCTTCQYTTNTWSEELTTTGHTGCVRLLRDAEHKPLTEEEVIGGIAANVLGFGWIKPGHICYNDQIIVKAVSFCKFYQKRI